MQIITGPTRSAQVRRRAAAIVSIAMLASPTSWLLMLAMLAVGAVIISVPLQVGVLAALMPALYVGALWAVLRFIPSPRDGQWWIGHAARGSAAVCLHHDKRGHLVVTFLAARPRKVGLGTELIQQVRAQHPNESLSGTAFRTTALRYYRNQLGANVTPIRGTFGLFYRVRA